MENGYIQMVHFSKEILKIIYQKDKVNGAFKMAIPFKEFIIKQKELIQNQLIKSNLLGKQLQTSQNQMNEILCFSYNI
jgi:hypothetical protein